MAYDEGLAQRVRETLCAVESVVEKRMFGGVGYLVRGNMACGVHGDGLIVRVGAEAYEVALAEAHTRPFDMTGRPMTGWVVVEPDGCADDGALKTWVRRGVDYSSTLPAK